MYHMVTTSPVHSSMRKICCVECTQGIAAVHITSKFSNRNWRVLYVVYYTCVCTLLIPFSIQHQVFVLRKRATHQIPRPGTRFYICSLSLYIVVYKGQLTSDQLWIYFKDLKVTGIFQTDCDCCDLKDFTCTFKMEVTGPSETLVTMYETTCSHYPAEQEFNISDSHNYVSQTPHFMDMIRQSSNFPLICGAYASVWKLPCFQSHPYQALTRVLRDLASSLYHQGTQQLSTLKE